MARKTSKYHICLHVMCLYWVMWLLTSCASSSKATNASYQYAKTTTPFALQIISRTPYSPIPTNTPGPRLSNTTTATPTPTPAPTLNKVEQNKVIQDLMNSSSGCNLPCFWGITPGITSWSEKLPLLQSLRALIEAGPKARIRNIREYPKDNGVTDFLYNTFLFGEKEGKIHTISIEATGPGVIQEFASIWQAYSPENIVRAYGKPTRVLVGSSPLDLRNRGWVPYFVWLFYDDRGIMIRYQSGTPYRETYHLCPKISKDGEIDGIFIQLQASDDPDRLEKGDAIITAHYYKILSFEDATGKTLNDFYNLFLEGGGVICFNVPKEVWQ